jgi:ABC-type polysaccharide/polyol phosphate export permease
MKLVDNLKETYKHRLLIRTLVGRELKARYRGTVLGFFLSFFNPLLLMDVYTVVFGFILKPRDPRLEKAPGITLCICSADCCQWTCFPPRRTTRQRLMINGNLIKKILFPGRGPADRLGHLELHHFLFGLPILLIFLVVLGKPLTAYALLAPVVMLIQYVFTLGFSLLLAALTVHFRDIKDILSNLLTFWFFSTPIVYSLGMLGESSTLRRILDLNPMTHIIGGYHDCLFFGQLSIGNGSGSHSCRPGAVLDRVRGLRPPPRFLPEEV